MFVDLVKIHISAGNGGNGAVAFHREKYVPAGGPDGGDGGNGGNVVFIADTNLSTLMDFRYKRKYAAQNGGDGTSRKMSGKNAPDLIIRVPKGTIIRDAQTNLIIKDISDGEPFIAAHGGKGGWGNQHFATPTRQAPRFAKAGRRGESLEILLELKLLADVGLIGFPNVGKSTLLSIVSAARPKIANFHFTTLIPNLGVVAVDETTSFVMADIPGIIEGASEGQGLGHEFMRHIERCRLLIHIVDAAGSEGRDPVEDFELINKELALHNPELATRKQIVAANKTDLIQDGNDGLERLRAHIKKTDFTFIEISGATQKGINELMKKTAYELSLLPPVTVYEPEYVRDAEAGASGADTEITVEDGVYILSGEWLENLIGSVNLEDYDSLNYLQRVLKKNGVFEKLENAGIAEGDTVSIYEFEFEYIR